MFSAFLARCLEVDPEKRPTAEQLLQDPFLRRTDSLRSLAPYLLTIFLSTTNPFSVQIDPSSKRTSQTKSINIKTRGDFFFLFIGDEKTSIIPFD